jgi:hypothetical protein
MIINGGNLRAKAWLLMRLSSEVGHSVGGSTAGGEHRSRIATSSREGVGVGLGGVEGTCGVVTRAGGANDMAGAKEGTEGAETGMEAVVQAHTSRLAQLHFFLVLQKTSALMPSPSRISSKKTKRVLLPLLTG